MNGFKKEEEREATIKGVADLLGNMVAQTPEGQKANRTMAVIRAGGDNAKRLFVRTWLDILFSGTSDRPERLRRLEEMTFPHWKEEDADNMAAFLHFVFDAVTCNDDGTPDK